MAAEHNFHQVSYHLLQTGAKTLTLAGHGHWVNTLALSAEYALRTGAYDHTAKAPASDAEGQQVSLVLWLPPMKDSNWA